jgi:hypothetical protein
LVVATATKNARAVTHVAGATPMVPLQEVDVQALDAATFQSMTLDDAQQQRLLERLRRAGDQPVAFAELHASGIDFPATVVSELQLNGYAIDRVYDRGRLVGVRLLKPEPPYTPATHRRRLRPWRQR